MDQARIKRPTSDHRWLWWGLGSFFALVIAYRIGAWSVGISQHGGGKKVGIVHINGPIVSGDGIVKQLEKFIMPYQVKKKNDQEPK